MKNIVSFGVGLVTSLIVLVSMPIHANATPAIKKLIDDPLYYSRPDTFFWQQDTMNLSEYEIIEQKGKEFSLELRKALGLEPGFDSEQFGQAYAELVIDDWRRELSLPPAFNETLLATALGARETSAIRQKLDLATNFDSDEVRRAITSERFKDTASFVPGLEYPFSYQEYEDAIGKEEAGSLALIYRLPRDWDYPNLIDYAGPIEAARLRRQYGFAKTATHDEIVSAIGTAKAHEFIETHNLPEGFTREALENDASSPDWRQERNGYNIAPYTEYELGEALGKIQLAKLVKTYDLPAHFTESEARTALARPAIESMTLKFAVEADFHEKDLETAYALSLAAYFRSYYNLRTGFSANELDKAVKEKNSNMSTCYY